MPFQIRRSISPAGFLLALGIFVILSAELAALSLHDRRFVLWAAGAAALFALVSARQLLGDVEPPPATVKGSAQPPADARTSGQHRRG